MIIFIIPCIIRISPYYLYIFLSIFYTHYFLYCPGYIIIHMLICTSKCLDWLGLDYLILSFSMSDIFLKLLSKISQNALSTPHPKFYHISPNIFHYVIRPKLNSSKSAKPPKSIFFRKLSYSLHCYLMGYFPASVSCIADKSNMLHENLQSHSSSFHYSFLSI